LKDFSWKINGPKSAKLYGKKKVYKTPDFYDKFYQVANNIPYTALNIYTLLNVFTKHK